MNSIPFQKGAKGKKCKNLIFKEIRHRIYEYEDTYGVAIDPKIINAKEFEMNRMPFIQNVMKDGSFYGV